MSDSPTEFQQKDLALRRYAAILGYLQYEWSTYWVRAQHFLVANSLLVGLALPHLPASRGELLVPRLATLFCVSIAGLVLTLLWERALKAGIYWVSHWQSALQELEGAAYGDLRLHREFPEKPGRERATAIAKSTANVFKVIWILAIVYLLTAAVIMIHK